MKATIQKWGNSLGVRIPSVMAKDLMLEHGSEVELIEEDDRIIIRPQRGPRLEDLLEAINESNIHEEVETDGSRGNNCRDPGKACLAHSISGRAGDHHG